jgi:LmbE family N-acetylglucosaminyl deacetylase
MLRFPLSSGDPPVRRVLALGAHADDIEIGCGAALLALTRANPAVEVTWVVFAASGERADEARRSAETFLASAASADVVVHGFRDGYLPHAGAEVKDLFEELKSRVEPDLVFTHTRHDLHQDHRAVCELTWNTWRRHLVLEYEIPKYDGDFGAPNVFVPVSRELAVEKARTVVDAFPSQQVKHWFDEELLLGVMRLRGMEAASESGYAEAFTCRKLSLLLA